MCTLVVCKGGKEISRIISLLPFFCTQNSEIDGRSDALCALVQCSERGNGWISCMTSLCLAPLVRLELKLCGFISDTKHVGMFIDILLQSPQFVLSLGAINHGSKGRQWKEGILLPFLHYRMVSLLFKAIVRSFSLNRIYFHIRHNTYTIQKYAFQGIEKQV